MPYTEQQLDAIGDDLDMQDRYYWRCAMEARRRLADLRDRQARGFLGLGREIQMEETAIEAAEACVALNKRMREREKLGT